MCYHRKHSSRQVGQKTLCFEALEERNLLTPIFVRNVTDDGTNVTNSLSWAINQVNASPAQSHEIHFLLNTSPQNPNPEHVDVTGVLPKITAPNVIINGLFGGISGTDKRVTIRDVQNSGTDAPAFVYQGDASSTEGHFQVQDIKIRQFERDAIQIESLGLNDRVTVENTKIDFNGGISIAGSGIHFLELPYGSTGDFTITNNELFNNGRNGIFLEGGGNPAPTATSNILNNFIGTTSAGSTGVTNGQSGIALADGAEKITIEGNTIYSLESHGAIELKPGALDEVRISDNTFRVGSNLPLQFPIDLLADFMAEVPDEGDEDSGPNNLLNSPVIFADQILEVSNGNSWQIPVEIEVDATGEYRVEFYGLDPVSEEWRPLNVASTIDINPGEEGTKKNFTVTFSKGLINEGEMLSAITIGLAEQSLGIQRISL